MPTPMTHKSSKKSLHLKGKKSVIESYNSPMKENEQSHYRRSSIDPTSTVVKAQIHQRAVIKKPDKKKDKKKSPVVEIPGPTQKNTVIIDYTIRDEQGT